MMIRFVLLGFLVTSLVGCSGEQEEDRVELPTSDPTELDGCEAGGYVCCEEGPCPQDLWGGPWLQCFGLGKCERQGSGECDWSPSPELTRCLEDYDAPEYGLIE